ncbi:MAG: hypothetical protein H0T62_06055 [Parachlamydiaceae bacterium]|nr:hypothetical protein [Parachlamydiaceae bacterium]
MSYIIPSAGPTTVITSVSGLLSAHGLAGLVQLVYIRIGNEVMAQALNKLETALSATQSALVVLTDVQGLHNQIGVGIQSGLPFNFTASNTQYTYIRYPTSYSTLTTRMGLTGGVGAITADGNGNTTFTYIGGSPAVFNDLPTTILSTNAAVKTTDTVYVTRNNRDDYIRAYNILGSAFYGKPIDPYFAITLPGALTATPILATTSAEFLATPVPAVGATAAQIAAQLAAHRATVSGYNEFKTQLAVSKATISGLIKTLSGITPLTRAGEIDATTLLAKLRIVYAELPSGSFTSVRAWVLDSYNVKGSSAVIKAGGLQSHITNAITAAQSSNSAQNSAVRRYMFIFEQYYQSASSVMSALNQAMLSISRKLSG